MKDTRMSMKQRRLLFQTLPIVIMVVCLVFVVCSKAVAYKNCTEETTAQIVSYRKSYNYNDEFDHYKFIPTLKYQVNGVWYAEEPTVGSPPFRSAVGDFVTIKYNPQLPQEYCIPSGSELLLFAVVMLPLSIYVTINLVKDEFRRH